MNKRHVLAIAFVFVLATALAILPGAVQAHTDSSRQTEAERAATRSAAERAREEAKKLAEERREAEKARQAATQNAASTTDRDAFKSACEARRDTFKRRMEVVTDGLQNRTTALDTAVQRVTSFVGNRKLTVASYDALLVDVETKHMLIETIAAAAKESAAAFDCSTHETARNSLAAFTDAIHDEIEVLSGYKTAVKALIAAVKSSAQAAEGAPNARQ